MQVGGLIQPVLAERRSGGNVFHRCIADRPERAEVRVVHSAARLELGDRAEQLPVGVGRGADDELHGHPGGAAGVQRILRLSGGLRLALLQHQLPHLLERRPSVVAKLLSGAICARLAPQAASKLSDTRLASAVSRSICAVIATGHQLHVDVSAEPVPLPQQLERLDQLVHHVDRPARNAGGDEEPLAPASPMGAEEDAHQLLGLEQRARHGPIPPHGAVVTVEGAGVGHQDAEQRHPHAGQGAEIADVERAERADLSRVPQPGRKALPIVRGERHQFVELPLQLHVRHGALSAQFQ